MEVVDRDVMCGCAWLVDWKVEAVQPQDGEMTSDRDMGNEEIGGGVENVVSALAEHARSNRQSEKTDHGVYLPC